MTNYISRIVVSGTFFCLLLCGAFSCAPVVSAENEPEKAPDPIPEKPAPDPKEEPAKPAEWFVRGVTLIATSEGRYGPAEHSKVLAWDLTRTMYLARVGGRAGREDEALEFSVDSRGVKDGRKQVDGAYTIRVHKKGFHESTKYRLTFRLQDDAKSERSSIILLPRPMAKKLKDAVDAKTPEVSLDFTRVDEKDNSDTFTFAGTVSSSTFSLQPVSATWAAAEDDEAGQLSKLDCKDDGAAIAVTTYEFTGALETHKDGKLIKNQTIRLIVSADPEWPVVLSLKEDVSEVGKGDYEAWNYSVSRFVPAPNAK